MSETPALFVGKPSHSLLLAALPARSGEIPVVFLFAPEVVLGSHLTIPVTKKHVCETFKIRARNGAG